jgi:hypothetical protein
MSWVWKRSLTVVGVITLWGALLIPSLAAASATPVAGDGNWLFTVSFDSGALSPLTDSDGSAMLTLTGIDPVILAFTDRPERMVALVQAQTFVEILQATKNDPPNAALASQQAGSGQEEPIVIELRSAIYDATAETLSFEVGMVPGQSEATPIGSSVPPSTLQGGYLFIDDVQIPVKIPINLCGNSVGVIGLLNPSFGNTCVKD